MRLHAGLDRQGELRKWSIQSSDSFGVYADGVYESILYRIYRF